MKITPQAFRKLLDNHPDVAEKYSIWREVRGKQARHFTKAGLSVLAHVKDGNRGNQFGDNLGFTPDLSKQVLVENQAELLKTLPEIMARLATLEAQSPQKTLINRNGFALPAPTVIAPQISDRDKVREIVFDYSQSQEMPIEHVWTHLYAQFYYRCKVNVTARAKRTKKRKLDIIEELGLMPQLYAIACEILI